MLEDAQLGPDDLRRVIDGKQRVLEQDGLLEYYPADPNPVRVAGADNLLRWLGKRRAIIREPERARAFGLTFPKGLFLSWLQERQGDVFVVATANDVTKLPPELIRKGRFDEVFFLDLPDGAARQEILEIHLTRRRRDSAGFDLAALAHVTVGFSGAELEQVIVSALYTAFSEGNDITTQLLLAEVQHTVPLSLSMRERLEVCVIGRGGGRWQRRTVKMMSKWFEESFRMSKRARVLARAFPAEQRVYWSVQTLLPLPFLQSKKASLRP